MQETFKRLEVSIRGALHLVGAIPLPKRVVKEGLKAFGQGQWTDLITDIALGLASRRIIARTEGVVGASLKPIYRMQGVSMQGNRFGLEVFHAGRDAAVDHIGASHKTIDPGDLLKACAPGDMLGVFHARRDGVLSFRWDGVDPFRQEDLVLEYEDCAPMLGGKSRFELATGVTWQGLAGPRNAGKMSGRFYDRRHVFHTVR
ncbi:hypothetical protein GM415_07840 [Pseudodesulfovibrio cashew]|uniref:Uncharacterized protein n=1 Tax=Pseudodesulfovibrio cashew TaxID=2678688 RepID=A0A6I6JGA4_9BACT|nr:hypothetical protein [Pseudodesulfovibrio cashew]QGY40040.1 hypothetical protein GM415_07840 [Pseudodesulfovibrio cashew]